jgi:hypothetical protein
VVEVLEVVRAFIRVRSYGWQEGLSVYSPTQWSRNFTYGMFYAFTLQFQRSPAAPDSWATGLQEAILGYGHYVVLALLLAEIALFFYDRIEVRMSRIATGGSAKAGR